MGISRLGIETGRLRRLIVAGSATALLGCGSPPGSAPAPPRGAGTATGSAGGHTVRSVAAAYFIGQSDDPANTTVIYVFDSAVACADLGAPGWDSKIHDQTGALEMKLLGKAPGTYAVSTSPSATANESTVNFTVSSTTATPKEQASTTGSVTLGSIEPDLGAAGSFDLTFPDGTLRGTFDAAWCAGGHEP